MNRREQDNGFPVHPSTEKAERVSEAALTALSSPALARGATDLVDLVQLVGAAALPPGFINLPHMRRPPWRTAAGGIVQVRLRATLRSSDGAELGVSESLALLQRGRQLRFEALQTNGLPLPSDYQVEWRVTNTDKMARAERALRGDFYPSHTGNCRSETLRYRGVHMVEAFVIRKRDQRLVGKSPAHMVVIQ